MILPSLDSVFPEAFAKRKGNGVMVQYDRFIAYGRLEKVLWDRFM